VVFHQRKAQVAQFRLLPLRFLLQARFGVGRRGISRIGTPLAPEVDAGIAGIVGGFFGRAGLLVLEALLPGSGFDQRGVDRAVLVRQQLKFLSLGQHLVKEGLNHRSRFLLKTVESQIGSSMVKPTNH
jgi:hypothetical protein